MTVRNINLAQEFDYVVNNSVCSFFFIIFLFILKLCTSININYVTTNKNSNFKSFFKINLESLTNLKLNFYDYEEKTTKEYFFQ